MNQSSSNILPTLCRRTVRFFTLTAMAVGWFPHAHAYDIELDVEPRHVEQGQTVSVTFRFQGIDNPPQPTLSGIDDFHLQGNPRLEYATTASMSGRSQTSHRTVAWTYRLSPKRLGELTIGPMNYTAKGETKVLPQAIINVVESSRKQELFAEITVPTTNIYLHQTFDVILSIYSRNLHLGGDFRLSDMPDSRVSFQPFQEVAASPELRNKQVYQVKRFKGEARALASGQFSFEPSLGVGIQVEQQRRRRRTAFDFFLGGPQVEYTQIQPTPVDIVIQPLPEEGRPESFSGAVGQFDFGVSAQPREVNEGDPINVTMTIKGHGNIDSISAPTVVLGDTFKVYDARLVDKQLSDQRDRGMKVFEQVIMPRSETIEEIPAYLFSYFDPENARYRTLTQGPFPIQVAASATSSDVLQQETEQERATLKVLEQDIVYLKPAPPNWHKTHAKPWYKRTGFIGVNLIPVVGCLLAWFGAKRRDELSQDIARTRKLQAPKAARSAMALARSALEQDDVPGFHEAVWGVLSTYFENFFNLSAGMISRQLVMDRLANSNLPEEDRQALDTMFEQCELARFGSVIDSDTESSHHDKCKEIYDELNRLLKACEKTRKAT